MVVLYVWACKFLITNPLSNVKRSFILLTVFEVDNKQRAHLLRPSGSHFLPYSFIKYLLLIPAWNSNEPASFQSFEFNGTEKSAAR